MAISLTNLFTPITRPAEDSNANQTLEEAISIKRFGKTSELVNAATENDSNFNKIHNAFLSDWRLICVIRVRISHLRTGSWSLHYSKKGIRAMKPKQAAASNVEGDSVEAVVDLAHLDQYTLGDHSLQAELLQLFRVQLKNQTQELVSCADETDWKSAVHTLKGAARSIGAVQIGEVAEAMELVAFSDDAGRAAVLSRLIAVHAAFEAQIEEYL
ncbi:MAG: Hpt domain-containing protein [Anderseniella sp.]